MPRQPKPPRPDVSVIIAAWCDAEGVRRATASALAQRHVNVEVIVVDDASPDDTAEAARAVAARDPRVRVLTRAVNGGPGAARNRGFAVARGAWIAVLDSDDTMAPCRLRRMIDLAVRSGADVVLGNIHDVHKPGETMGSEPVLPTDRPAAPLSPRAFVRGNLRAAGARTLGFLKPLLRRDFVEQAGLRYDETLRNGEDCHLIFAAYAAGARVWVHPASDYAYLRREGSLSARSDPAHLAALLAAEVRIAPALEAASPGQRLRPLLRARRRALLRMMTVERAMRSLKDGRARAAARALLRHPAALPRMAVQLGEAAGKRRPKVRRTAP